MMKIKGLKKIQIIYKKIKTIQKIISMQTRQKIENE